MQGIFKLFLAVLLAAVLTVPVARADVNIVIDSDGDVFYRRGSDTISGTVFRVKRDVLKVTVGGHWVEVDVSQIRFGDNLKDIFTEGMVVQLEGAYEDSNDFKAVAVTFTKDGKTYTYRSKVGVKAPLLYRLIK